MIFCWNFWGPCRPLELYLCFGTCCGPLKRPCLIMSAVTIKIVKFNKSSIWQHLPPELWSNFIVNLSKSTKFGNNFLTVTLQKDKSCQMRDSSWIHVGLFTSKCFRVEIGSQKVPGCWPPSWLERGDSKTCGVQEKLSLCGFKGSRVHDHVFWSA